jgi:hypothetical protein
MHENLMAERVTQYYSSTLTQAGSGLENRTDQEKIMEKLLEKMGFVRSEIDALEPEIEKFLSSQKEFENIKKDIKTIKVSLILLVFMVALSMVS